MIQEIRYVQGNFFEGLPTNKIFFIHTEQILAKINALKERYRWFQNKNHNLSWKMSRVITVLTTEKTF